jgi:hypothetical protein
MQKRLARSLWCASSLILLSGLLGAGTPAQGEWNQRALSQPEAVSAWLQANTQTADRRMAQLSFEMGMKAQKQGRWSPAVKAFAESALDFPTPAALVGYADNQLRSLSSVRARNKDTSKAKDDLASALALYRSALAADAQLKQLAAPALAELKADEACLDAHLKADGKQAAACRPVQIYASGS